MKKTGANTMPQSTESNPFSALSGAMADAVVKAGRSTVMVNARRRLPASGIAFASDFVLTASHVVEQEESIPIIIPDDSERTATLVGRDTGSDLALLRLNQGGLQVAELAAGEARVGELVLAIGRPDRQGIQASMGVVGSIGGPVRDRRGGLLERYITTDTIPYPGFSGGPLINTAGQVLGINTSGLLRGTSLTLPHGLAWGIGEILARHGQVRRGYLGIRSQPVELQDAQLRALDREQSNGLLLVGIEKDSPASHAGLLVGDILVGFSGQAVSDPDELIARLVSAEVGEQTTIQIIRGVELLLLSVIIGERK
jgi:S1-C subfamily serine protease